MSLRTRINGFTAWVNLRLTPYNQLLNNVLMDLLTGTHMKYLVESFTGSRLKGLENMDGLTDAQKQTRIDWVVAELKKTNVIADDVFVDTRLFAMRSADHVFNLLWRLISHDIWFVWERAEYLQVDDLDVLTQVPFKWTPDPPPKKKKQKNKTKKSLLSGFGPSVGESGDDKSEKSEEGNGIALILPGDNAKEKHLYMPGVSYEKVLGGPEGEVNKPDKPAVEYIDLISAQVGNTDEASVDKEWKVDDKSKLHVNAEKDASKDEMRDPELVAEDDLFCNAELDVSTSGGKKEMVSIYIVPLNDIDTDNEDDSKEFLGRASPWPEDDPDIGFDEIEIDEYKNDASSEHVNEDVDSEMYSKIYRRSQEFIAQKEESKLLVQKDLAEAFRSKGDNFSKRHIYTKGSNSDQMTRNSTEPPTVLFGGCSFMFKDSKQPKGTKTHDTKGENLTSTCHHKGSNSPFERMQTPFLHSNVDRKFDTPDVFTPLPNIDDLPENQDDNDEKWIKFPNAEYMKGFKKRSRSAVEDYPTPDECILEMVNYQLKLSRDGKGLFCYSIDDFVDSRVLCALVNSFVPNTFTADLLLNDRWTINLALKTAEKMFYAETPFDAEDLAEADPMAVSSYFAFFLMVAYRYRQTTAVVNRVDFINMLIRECNHELEKFPPIISNMLQLQHRKDLKQQLDQHRQAIENIQKKYDVEFCKKWVQHVEHVQNELRREIRDKMRNRFDIVEIPRNITINDFCLAAVINLSLTNGSGFYLTNSKENLSEGRRLVLRNTDTGEFIEDFTNKSKMSIKDALHIPDKPGQVIEVNPENYPEYEFFFEAQSRNKQLKTGSYFLYQVFPGNTSTWQRLFIKSAKEAEFETVEKMIAFFREDNSFINCREPKSGNTALHLACRNGHFDIVRLLLENGAKVDLKNNFRCTPINLAIESLQRKICHYLIEWGCDVHSKNVKGQTVLETIKNDDFKRFCFELYDYYSDVVPKIMAGDMNLLDKVIENHKTGVREFCCLRSRIINGSTLLHTACYYGHIPAIKELLSLRVDVNLRDYKGATPLHRADNPEVMEILLESGAHVNSEDSESNTPLHVKCYGETNKPSEIECIQMLLNKNVNILIRNSRGLMPIHCCVMQGRIDVMQILLHHDKNNTMATSLSKENDKKPPSLIHLALANNFINCAEWLLKNGFEFKEKEQDILVRRILTEQIKLEKRTEAIKFLLDNGAESNPRYPGGNSALHYAAGLSGPSDVLELLVAYKADFDAINDDGCSPLFFAAQSNNKYAACVLIEQGTNVRQKNSQGLTAFDYIVDFEEWIECGYFNEEIKARLKAYNLKHARDLIRAISKRVKPGQLPMIKTSYKSASSGMSSHFRTPSSMSRTRALPPMSSTGVTPSKYVLY